MNCWKILGIQSTSDIATIKKAYAKLAAECHIERDQKGFQLLHEAYVDAMEIAKAQAKRLPQETKEQPEPKPAAFRAVPGNLRKLGLAGSVDDEAPPVQEESRQPEPDVYQFLPPEDINAKSGEEQGEGYDFPTGQGASPSPENEPEDDDEDWAPGYAFPRPVGKPGLQWPLKEPLQEAPPKQNGGYTFPKGDVQNQPPSPENEGTEATPGYVFPRSADTSDPESPPKKSPQQDAGYSFPENNTVDAPTPEEMPRKHGEYQFPKGTPDGPPPPPPPQSAPAPLRGLPVARTGGMIFPGILPLGDMHIPFMPLPLGGAEESFPQTKEELERLQILDNARKNCLEDMRNLLEQDAPEQAWYPILLGADFTLIQYSGKFLQELQTLCLKQLSPAMGSALYTAYGFASNKALRKYPVASALHAFLNQTLQLPQEDIPFLPLSETLHKSDIALKGLVRLFETCSEPYICDQAVRARTFTQIQHQPYFIFKLTVFLGTNDVTDMWRQALAQAYQFHEPPVSPCLQVLAELLPAAIQAPVRAEYHPTADNLLLDEAALGDFYVAARNDMLSLLRKTRKAFPKSSRRGPWDYLFTRPEIELVRCDAQFLAGLLGFLQEGLMPVGIWAALADAYAAEFATLPPEAPVIQEALEELSPKEQVTACLMMLRYILETPKEAPPENPSFWKIVKSMLRSI